MEIKDFREKFYEIIDGESFLFPSSTLYEASTICNLLIPLHDHVSKNKLGFILMHLVFKLPDGNTVIPDLIFIGSDKEKLVKTNPDDMFQGVPDMVVEIFSHSTMKRDLGIKKDIYERNGVKEYWIIDPYSEYIQVYLLRDGKYVLDNVYHNYSDEELSELTDEERSEIQMEVPVAVLDGFKVKIRNIFGWSFE